MDQQIIMNLELRASMAEEKAYYAEQRAFYAE